MLIVYFGIGWFIGLWLAAKISLSLAVWLLIAGAGGAATALFRKHFPWQWVFAGLVGVGLGGGRYIKSVPIINESHIAYYNEEDEIIFTGLVADEPDVRDRFVNLRVAVDSLILADGRSQPIQGAVLVRTFRFPVIPYGARLQVTGLLETPPEFDTFSYKDYLARQGIHSLINTPQLTILAEGEGSPFKQAIFAFKTRAQVTINSLISDPQAALLSGILLGNDNGIAPDLALAFRVTGMTHIIAISG